MISSSQIENISTRPADLPPKWIWLSDGKTLQQYDTETRSFDPSAANQRWTAHPLESAGELMQILFPFYLEGAADEPIQVIREETFIGRPALVIDWGSSRFWIDEDSGSLCAGKAFLLPIIQSIRRATFPYIKSIMSPHCPETC